VTNKAKKFQGLAPRKLREIWNKISPADWLSVLQENRPTNNWAIVGHTIKGCCPYHGEQKPSFTIDFDRRQAKCFGCDKYVWDPTQFYAHVANMSRARALQDLRKRFNIRIPAAYTQNAQQLEDNERLKAALFRAMHLEFTEALMNDSAPEYQYLHKSGFFPWLRQRKLPEETAHKWPVGVMPTRSRLMARLDEINASDMKAAAAAYLGTYLSTPGAGDGCQGWFVFFYCTSPTTIGRLKLRRPHLGPRTADKADYYFVPDPYDEDFGYFGLNTFSHLRGKTHTLPLYVMEGEMDVLALLAHQEAEGQNDIFAIATSGKGEFGIDSATEFGFDHVRLIPDNDSGGKNWAIAIFNENEHVDRVFRWNDPTVKDPDEAIRQWGFEVAYDRLRDQVNYPRNFEWCAEQLDDDLLACDPSDVARRNEIVARYGQSLHNDAERAAFLTEACQHEDIHKELVLQDMSISEDTPEAFMRRLKNQFRRIYHFVHESQAGAQPLAKAWSNKKKTMRTFQLSSDRSVVRTIEMDTGNIEEYIRAELGEPDFLNFRMGPRGAPIQLSPTAKSQQVVHLCSQALAALASEAVPADRLKQIGQGIHFFPDYAGAPTLFIVNGTTFFRGTVDAELGKVTYEELDSPIHDDFTFELAPKRWSDNIKTLDDIQEGLNYNISDLYEQVLDIMRVGWRFKDHELSAQFMAADVLYTGAASVFSHMVMTDITGESHSGKTSLMQLMGGSEFGPYRLCDAAFFIDDFTAAAVRQLMSGHCLRLLLDEFEDTDSQAEKTDKKAAAVREVLNMIRSLVSGARSIRGTSGGTHQDFNMKFPLTVGGIYTMREFRDLNRFVHIRTQFMEGFNDPIVPIKVKYTVKQITDLRRGLALCWLPRVPQLLKAYEDIKTEFADNASLPAGIYTRLKDNIMPAAAIMKLAGHDYKTFMVEFSKAKMEELIEQGATKESANIWSHIIHTPVALSNIETGRSGFASVAKIVTNKNLAYLLNDADLGAYYLADKGWLIVFWQKVVTGILQRSNVYRGARFPHRLKGIADGDPRVIRRDVIRRGAFMKDHVWPLVGAHITPDDISVIDLRSTLTLENLNAPSSSADVENQKRALLDDIGDEDIDGEIE